MQDQRGDQPHRENQQAVRWDFAEQPKDSERQEGDTGNGEDDPSRLHESISIRPNHLVFSTPARFGERSAGADNHDRCPAVSIEMRRKQSGRQLRTLHQRVVEAQSC